MNLLRFNTHASVCSKLEGYQLGPGSALGLHFERLLRCHAVSWFAACTLFKPVEGDVDGWCAKLKFRNDSEFCHKLSTEALQGSLGGALLDSKDMVAAAEASSKAAIHKLAARIQLCSTGSSATRRS